MNVSTNKIHSAESFAFIIHQSHGFIEINLDITIVLKLQLTLPFFEKQTVFLTKLSSWILPSVFNSTSVYLWKIFQSCNHVFRFLAWVSRKPKTPKIVNSNDFLRNINSTFALTTGCITSIDVQIQCFPFARVFAVESILVWFFARGSSEINIAKIVKCVCICFRFISLIVSIKVSISSLLLV